MSWRKLSLMRFWKLITHILLTVLLAFGANSLVSAKVASGAQNLSWTGHQADGVFNWLTHQGKSARSTTGPPGSPVATKSVTQVVRNSAQGELGEAAVRSRLLNSNTVDLVGEQVRINTPGIGSHRVTDFLVRGKNTGKLRVIEVKTGGATRDATQLAKDRIIADPVSATTFSGRRARAAGFPNGTPTGPIPTFEVNASNLNR